MEQGARRPRGRTPGTAWRRFGTAALAAGLVAVAGCRPAGETAGGALRSVPRTVRTVRIAGDDTMQFSELQMDAVAGERLRVIFSNTGTRPRESMGHNWVLLHPAPEAEVMAFGLAAATAAPDYLPDARRGEIVAATRMLGPGETDTVEFTVPSKPGEYPYLCTFPGHFALMRGWLIVR